MDGKIDIEGEGRIDGDECCIMDDSRIDGDFSYFCFDPLYHLPNCLTIYLYVHPSERWSFTHQFLSNIDRSIDRKIDSRCKIVWNMG